MCWRIREGDSEQLRRGTEPEVVLLAVSASPCPMLPRPNVPQEDGRGSVERPGL